MLYLFQDTLELEIYPEACGPEQEEGLRSFSDFQTEDGC